MKNNTHNALNINNPPPHKSLLISDKNNFLHKVFFINIFSFSHYATTTTFLKSNAQNPKLYPDYAY